MALIVLIGAQAVGKMTVGKAIEQKIDGKLLYNHQTIDLFANFLSYNDKTFYLSDLVRKNLFQAFVDNQGHNTTETMIFTVLIAFDSPGDLKFLNDIAEIFIKAKQDVYFVELTTNTETRLSRNQHPARLKEKPSKRDLVFSKQELLESDLKHRLVSDQDELEKLFPHVNSLKIDNTHLSAEHVAEKIIKHFNFKTSLTTKK